MEPRDYGPFPYVPINDRPKLEWPGGARLAVWIIPNIEFFPLTRGIAGSHYDSRASVPSVRAWAQRDYGNRIGIWRIMDVMSKRGIRASPTLNSDICDHHPQIVKAAVELGWEILVHNETWSEANALHLFKTLFVLVAAHLLLLKTHARSLLQSTSDTPPDEADEFPQRLGLRDT